MNHSSPTNQLHKTSHIFILERAKPRRVSNFHPANIHFNSCWATPITIRSTRRWFQKKLLSGSSRIGLVALLFGFEPTCKVFAYFWAAPSHPRIANSTCCVLCLSQIKSGHTGGAIHPRSDGKECIQRAERGAVPAHPCSTIDAYVPHCSIACTTAGRDEDVVRLTRRYDRHIPVGSNRSVFQHTRFATGNAAMSVGRECPSIEVYG